MQTTKEVDGKARTAKRVVSTKYPVEKVKLLEAVQARRGDEFPSDTIRAALDEFIEKHFPGSIEGGGR